MLVGGGRGGVLGTSAGGAIEVTCIASSDLSSWLPVNCVGVTSVPPISQVSAMSKRREATILSSSLRVDILTAPPPFSSSFSLSSLKCVSL